jgi:hypothetical protein
MHCISGRSRKRNGVAHIGEARDVSDGALEAQSKTGVRHRTVAAQIPVRAERRYPEEFACPFRIGNCDLGASKMRDTGVVVTRFATSSIALLVGESHFVVEFTMDSFESYNANREARRDDDVRRRGVEASVERLIRRYGLSPDGAQSLSDGIYDLYRDLVAQKSLDEQFRKYSKARHRAEQALAVRTANASDCESEYVADAREFAAHMIHLETLEKRKLGRGRAIEQASKAHLG